MKPNADITIYNAYVDRATRSVKYHRAVIPGVTWDDHRGANRSQAGDVSANRASIFIPILRGGYVEPKAWQALATKTGWTLQAGDLIVRGNAREELSADFPPSALKAKYSDVVTISSVDRMDRGSINIQHWEVEAQ